jgi:hypothetical protein
MARLDEESIKAAIREIDDAAMRNIVKDAIKELVREQVAMFGVWSLQTFAVLLVGAAISAILWANGWFHK